MKRLLFISHRVPYPPDKGERVRAFHEVRALAERFRVTLAYLAHGEVSSEPAAAMAPWCERVIIARAGGRTGLLRGALGVLRGRSITEGYFSSGRLRKLLAAEAAREPFDLVFAYCTSTLPYALAIPAAGRVIDLVDIDSAKWAGYADSARWPRAWLYRREARTVRALERRAVQAFDAALVVSAAEVAASGIGSAKLQAVSNGVDLEYFAPAARPENEPPALVFTGQMDYPPNVEGVCWFAKRVWPALRQAVPELTFTIVGRDPVRAVRDLADLPGVTVTGTVPDIRGYLAAARVVVVPLLMARGIQNKVLEAMAMGRAVVASPAALEGLEVAVGCDVLAAETPEQWQQRIVELLTDGPLRSRLETSARRCVEVGYSWSARLAPLVSLCERLAGGGQHLAATARDTEPLRGKT